MRFSPSRAAELMEWSGILIIAFVKKWMISSAVQYLSVPHSCQCTVRLSAQQMRGG